MDEESREARQENELLKRAFEAAGVDLSDDPDEMLARVLNWLAGMDDA